MASESVEVHGTHRNTHKGKLVLENLNAKAWVKLMPHKTCFWRLGSAPVHAEGHLAGQASVRFRAAVAHGEETRLLELCKECECPPPPTGSCW